LGVLPGYGIEQDDIIVSSLNSIEYIPESNRIGRETEWFGPLPLVHEAVCLGILDMLLNETCEVGYRGQDILEDLSFKIELEPALHDLSILPRERDPVVLVVVYQAQFSKLDHLLLVWIDEDYSVLVDNHHFIDPMEHVYKKYKPYREIDNGYKDKIGRKFDQVQYEKIDEQRQQRQSDRYQ
jgi:hypothetical protein